MTTRIPVTGKTIAAFWSQAVEGTRLTCIANTYNPKAPGTTGIVAKPGKTSICLTTDNGERFWLSPPRRVSDVLEITPDTIRYRIGRDSHTATWRIHDGLQPIETPPAVVLTRSGAQALLPTFTPPPVRKDDQPAQLPMF